MMNFSICNPQEKFSTLVKFLRLKEREKIIVFVATCACVEYFSTLLMHFLTNQKVLSIHGKMKSKRHKIFDKFRKLESGVLICTDVMARGVDIPEMNQVVQFDPPSNAEAFVLRCGRTARIGNLGTALLVLQPNEDCYVEFLSINQKVVMSEMPAVVGVPDLLSEIRDLQKNDRDLMDKANRAFVSYIQSYVKHECKMILRVKDLNLGAIATSYGLLKMPKMPELKKLVMNFCPPEKDKIY